MPDIDWDFIGELEGGRHLTGYVPATSNSGVTLGIGVDLGQVYQANALPEPLQSLLAAYCGLRGVRAAAALEAAPVALTRAQADLLDVWAARRITDPLILYWNSESAVNWQDVPDRLATVVTSVAYQYGDVWNRCPRFWGNAIELDIPGVIHELDNFGDAYPTRRKREAAYLEAFAALIA